MSASFSIPPQRKSFRLSRSRKNTQRVVAATGDVVWRERLDGTYAASPIPAGGKIYITGDESETGVIAASKVRSAGAQSAW